MSNLNKYKLNFRKIVYSAVYNRRKDEWTEYTSFDYTQGLCFRAPRTLNEKRQNQEGYIRAKRRPHNLVSSWDDISISRKHTSWKDISKRKHQWKVVDDDNWIEGNRSR